MNIGDKVECLTDNFDLDNLNTGDVYLVLSVKDSRLKIKDLRTGAILEDQVKCAFKVHEKRKLA